MTRPIQLGKTYGVLHTESFFSFLGFAKKVGSDETQKIDVFLDNKLIDTIEANEFIQKIDDMYDVENKAFKYNLPSEHIGKKAIISFKNHDTQDELLNSPYTLIDKNHEKFNEAKFLHSLSEPLSEELRNMYKPNCVGFLATKENLEDEEFIEYINELIERFPNSKFKAFYTNLQDIKNKKDTLKFIKFISISDIGDVVKDIEIFIFNNYKVTLEVQLFSKIRESCKNILAFHSNFSIPNYKSITIQKLEKDLEAPLNKFINNYEKLGFEESDISKDKSYTKSYSNAIYRKFNLDKPITNLEQNAYKYFNFKTIEYALSSKDFKEFYFNMVLGQIDILNGNNK
ncbi:hypothetical protein QT384_06865 [Arcobacter cryaerophilus gv. pseudocryaerophilus]|uniref:Uncharacterized protein n=3 Tax=Arcobacteraceae TaxID=2808963 RepID=A0AA96II68_9BACT|nr:hypothetical protein RMP68_05770 [Arcobacter sp. AZ-2023]WNL35409.1 hypothetical protein RMQ66_06865 [Arcobacter sp. AZ-2023]WPD11125.1 hypothetical protein QT384_06865 [Arcobacter sp. DSM 115960]